MTTSVFVDTSALYAALDADDDHHGRGAAGLDRLLDELERNAVEAVTHSSVVVEITALVQRRLGMTAVRALLDDVLPQLHTVWVDADLHAQAVTALLAANHRSVSLVDWTSFVVMRRLGLQTAFAFDADFERQGFDLYAA